MSGIMDLNRGARDRGTSSRRDAASQITFVDASVLSRELRDAIHGEVRFDDGSRALYATDGSNYRQVPIGVVIPTCVEDVLATFEVCRRHGAPILSRGGGTSLTGGCCNTAVVIDWSKHLNKVHWIDPERRLAKVDPGTVLDHLRLAAEKHGLTLAPDPSTHTHCVIGGMIGNNSCGVHSLMGLGTGRTSDQIYELEVLLYDGTRLTVGETSEEELSRIIREGGRKGQIYSQLQELRDRYADEIRARYPQIPRRVSGYNLDDLLPEKGFHVGRALGGSEGTLVAVLSATMHLVPSPAKRSILVLGYPSIYEAGDHVPKILESEPIGLEGIDGALVDEMEKNGLHTSDVDLLPEGQGWLLVEFGGETKDESDAKASTLMEALKQDDNAPSMKLFDNEDEEDHLWLVRESGLAATARVPGEKDAWPGWEDSSVPPDRMGAYLRDLRALLERYDYKCALYGHFGQGCIHTRIDFGLKDPNGVRTFRAFLDDAADLVCTYGGSCSGEHGDGLARSALLPRMFGETIVKAFAEFKAIWDPDARMNPHRIVDPYEPDTHLRLGPHYRPPVVKTHFQFPDDGGSLAYATERCVGVGKCRKEESGTMCPSYMVTKEEMHSTRGRAHLLFEMFQGDPMKDGWDSEPVKEALDLCLACKACRTECPMNVDMATYKAEFLSHYYERNRRPVAAYSMGLIYWWARMASLMPGVANLVAGSPVLGKAMQWLGGISTERTMPAFAPTTFKQWWRQRPSRNIGRPRVLLWPDTFNNHFHPQTAIAAVEVLEHVGYQVVVPEASLCCGRPLYDFGMLTTAKSLLKRVIDTLAPEIGQGTLMVGLEPSCTAVFRDEMLNLFPMDESARRLANQTYTLGEFLQRKSDLSRLPRLRRKALVHGHCHHTHVMGLNCEQDILRRMGLDYQMLDSGCCGMAGSFGFEAENYDISVAVGERVLLPSVREASADTFIIADGFSCREQIAGLTDRGAMHLAQVMKMALREGSEGTAQPVPERFHQPLGKWHPEPTAGAKVFALGAGVLAGASLGWALSRGLSRRG